VRRGRHRPRWYARLAGRGGDNAPIDAPWTHNRWELPDPESADEHGIAGIGADLEPSTVLAAYRRGLFPMRVHDLLAWWSPDPRGVIPPAGFHVSRSLRRSIRSFGITVDAAFAQVIRACADARRPDGWIDPSFVDAYTRLHALGFAHSVEVWLGDVLAGGLYGVRIARFFAGESMFHHVTDASKVACWATTELLRIDGATLFDVQWATPHLRTLGAVEVTRREYLRRLARALDG
jgi:leucyl/phenylalanyl-tRNA--protein transferase